jgi:hypothetical protein
VGQAYLPVVEPHSTRPKRAPNSEIPLPILHDAATEARSAVQLCTSVHYYIINICKKPSEFHPKIDVYFTRSLSHFHFFFAYLRDPELWTTLILAVAFFWNLFRKPKPALD